MNTIHSDRFVRLPTALLESLLPIRLSGIQWRILLWVIRNTHGWGRRTTRYSWYGIARQIQNSRSQVHYEGCRLLKAGILVDSGFEIGIQNDPARWLQTGLRIWNSAKANDQHPGRLSSRNPNVSVRDTGHSRSENPTLSRRQKERSKEERKKETPQTADSAMALNNGAASESSQGPQGELVSPLSPSIPAQPLSPAPKAEQCAECQRGISFEWCPSVLVGERPLAGTGVWRSLLLDDRCPDCLDPPQC